VPIGKEPVDEEIRLFLAGVATGRIYMLQEHGRRVWYFAYFSGPYQSNPVVADFSGSLDDIGRKIKALDLTQTLRQELVRHKNDIGASVFVARLLAYRGSVNNNVFEQLPPKDADFKQEKARRISAIDDYMKANGREVCVA